jgi:ATP-dependent Clp protease ATP-binding subunit ClpB
MAQFMRRGDEYLAEYPNFKLVGRESELRQLSSILMRSKANSVLLVGPGGVGCTALCLGLQAMKKDPNAPFDIVSKRFFWLDTDELFSSGDNATINAAFQKIMHELDHTPDSVLIIEDTRDFIEAARNNGSMHFINALTLAVDRDKTQIILEARDDDLDMVLKCHSDIRESFTMMDLEEPAPGSLLEIVNDSAAKLTKFHGVRIAQAAVATAIELTTKYRTRDLGLSRAQPERSVTLLDRSMSSYRLSAHEKPERLRVLEQLLAKNGHKPDERAALEIEISHVAHDWSEKQGLIKTLYRAQRDGEIEVLRLEDELAAQVKTEESNRAAGTTEDAPRRLTGFADAARMGGILSAEVQDIKKRIAQFSAVVQENKAKFDALAEEINSQLELDRPLVLKEFSQISGIAVSKLNEDERAKLASLAEGLRHRIFGQDAVVDHVANGIRVARFGRRNKDKPLAFLFLGPSGVGKTELAKATAAMILDDEKALTRFDMSEYMEKHAVAKMIGAPPGYEGFEVGGILTNAMRKNPNRVLLFDEIEKAHPDVFNIFLQILSDGRLTDNVGRVVSFADAIIIMTTNIGQSHFLDLTASVEQQRIDALAELAQTYRSEFLNRFNGRQNIICFNRLGLDSVEKIVRREINQIDEVYREQGITTLISDADVISFCKSQYDPMVGARGLPGYIQVNLEPVIVNRLIEDPNVRGTLHVTWDAENKRFAVDLVEQEIAA